MIRYLCQVQLVSDDNVRYTWTMSSTNKTVTVLPLWDVLNHRLKSPQLIFSDTIGQCTCCELDEVEKWIVESCICVSIVIYHKSDVNQIFWGNFSWFFYTSNILKLKAHMVWITSVKQTSGWTTLIRIRCSDACLQTFFCQKVESWLTLA